MKKQNVAVRRKSSAEELYGLAIPPPTIPQKWDFAAADKEFDKHIRNWRRLTGDVISMLWVFYNKLAKPGTRTDLSPTGDRLPTWQEWLEGKGIGQNTPTRHFKALGWLDSELEWYQSSQSCEWETPQWLFDLLNNEFDFQTDVCATVKNAKCKRFFSKDHNSLRRKWRGVCWMNPPYGREIAEWMNKARESAQNGATIVCLVPARPDTDWWWENALAGEIRFIRGRIRFIGTTSAAPFPSAIVVLKPKACAGKVTWWQVSQKT